MFSILENTSKFLLRRSSPFTSRLAVILAWVSTRQSGRICDVLQNDWGCAMRVSLWGWKRWGGGGRNPCQLISLNAWIGRRQCPSYLLPMSYTVSVFPVRTVLQIELCIIAFSRLLFLLVWKYRVIPWKLDEWRDTYLHLILELFGDVNFVFIVDTLKVAQR